MMPRRVDAGGPAAGSPAGASPAEERPGGGRGGFMALALTQAASTVGSMMTGVAVGFAVYGETGSAAPLLLYAFFLELPAMAFGTLAGALVDRGDPRRMAILADAGQAVASAILAAAFLSGGFRIWMLYALALAQGAFAALQAPARELFVARLVRDEGRDRANAILAAAHPVAGMLAPALAGILYPLIGLGGVVIVDLASFAAAALGMAAAGAAGPGGDGGLGGPPGPETLRPPGLFASLAEMARFIRGPGRALGALLLWSAALNFFLNGPLELALPYAVERGGSEAAAGLALALQGAGGVVGSAALTLRMRSRSRIASLRLGMAAAGLFMVAAGLARSALGVGLALGATVACLQLWSRFTSIYQAAAPEGMGGRVLALAGQLGFLGSTASFALCARLAERYAATMVPGEPWALGFAFGSGPGSAMAALLALAGLCVAASSCLIGLVPGLRRFR